MENANISPHLLKFVPFSFAQSSPPADIWPPLLLLFMLMLVPTGDMLPFLI